MCGGGTQGEEEEGGVVYAYVEVQGQPQGLFFRVHPGWYLRQDSHWPGTNQAGLAQLASKPQSCLHLLGITSV